MELLTGLARSDSDGIVSLGERHYFGLSALAVKKRHSQSLESVLMELLTGLEPVTSSLPRKILNSSKGNALPKYITTSPQYIVVIYYIIYNI